MMYRTSRSSNDIANIYIAGPFGKSGFVLFLDFSNGENFQQKLQQTDFKGR